MNIHNDGKKGGHIVQYPYIIIKSTNNGVFFNVVQHCIFVKT